MSEQGKPIFLGNFGEILLTWHLRSKFKINVAIVKGKGIDLLCKDNEGMLLPKNQNIGISVKTRARKKENNLESVNIEWEKIKSACSSWGAIPYFSYIRIVPEYGTITFYLLEVSKAEQWGKQFHVTKAEKSIKPLFEMKFDQYTVLSDW